MAKLFCVILTACVLGCLLVKKAYGLTADQKQAFQNIPNCTDPTDSTKLLCDTEKSALVTSLTNDKTICSKAKDVWVCYASNTACNASSLKTACDKEKAYLLENIAHISCNQFSQEKCVTEVKALNVSVNDLNQYDGCGKVDLVLDCYRKCPKVENYTRELNNISQTCGGTSFTLPPPAEIKKNKIDDAFQALTCVTCGSDLKDAITNTTKTDVCQEAKVYLTCYRTDKCVTSGNKFQILEHIAQECNATVTALTPEEIKKNKIDDAFQALTCQKCSNALNTAIDNTTATVIDVCREANVFVTCYRAETACDKSTDNNQKLQVMSHECNGSWFLQVSVLMYLMVNVTLILK